jgi:hypothetical protein
MTIPDSPHLVSLLPRLVQPACLNFRWLSANQGEQEMNDHPAMTPICGWILPNYLDNSLMIYDNQGLALGSVTINPGKPWQPAPGSDTPIKIEEIVNPHLQKVVRYIHDKQIASLNQPQGQSFLQNFITTFNNALENIEPENYAQHQDLALLMGRPLALVRASLNLALQGLPAIHHGWHVFRQDMKRNTRETDNFTHVAFPINVGAYQQLNDGLVGYWKEADGGYENDLFYAPQGKTTAEPYIKTYANGPINIMQTVAGVPQTLTMLVDPRGEVHAASGILPVKAINIPPDKYADALRQINITFLSTPILTNQGQINLPLPTEPGYAWSWLEKEKETWLETGALGRVNLAASFSGQQEIREGWLKLRQADTQVLEIETQTENENL